MRFKNLKHKNRHSSLHIKHTDDPELGDSNKYRCQVCGWVCDTEYVAVRKGIKQPEDWADGNMNYTSDDTYDYPNINKGNGCPKCGSPNSR